MSDVLQKEVKENVVNMFDFKNNKKVVHEPTVESSKTFLEIMAKNKAAKEKLEAYRKSKNTSVLRGYNIKS